MYNGEPTQNYLVPPGQPKSSRRKYLLAGAGLLSVVGAVIVFTIFQPHKLFIDERVNEDFAGVSSITDLVPATTPPQGAAAAGPVPGGAPAVESRQDTDPVTSGPQVLAVGEFQPLDHPTVGQAYLVRDVDGTVVVRLENFETDNGPDLYVSLSTEPAGSRSYNQLTNLDRLKGNVGAQNYEVPDNIDLNEIQSVVIWCQRFGSAFGDAPLKITT